ncbi:MAG: DUF2934 domain-containing protein [Betaproteobacteria bacterium]|nr:DUF2934 domain-containing protein [Betaproteobacteria bacterium]
MLRKSNVKEKSGSARSTLRPVRGAPRSPPSKASASSPADSGLATISVEERHQMIARAAYFRAEQRGWNCGCADHDWLEAEAEIDRALGAMGGIAASS